MFYGQSKRGVPVYILKLNSEVPFLGRKSRKMAKNRVFDFEQVNGSFRGRKIDWNRFQERIMIMNGDVGIFHLCVGNFHHRSYVDSPGPLNFRTVM